MPEDSQMDIKIPDEPYNVIMDAGPLHVVTKQGPPPPGGFSIVASKVKKETTNEKMSGKTKETTGDFCGLHFCFWNLYLFLEIPTEKKINTKGLIVCFYRLCDA